MRDILLDSTGDLMIKNGDLVLGDATLQHQKHIIMANKGEFKEFPEVGVGIVDSLLDEDPKQILKTIKRQLNYDGQEVEELRIDTDGKIIVKAQYK